MIQIYQIGNYRVNLVASSNQGISLSFPTKFRRAADELTGVSGEIVYTTPGRPLVKSGSWKVSGALVCGSGELCASVDQQFSRLIANGYDVVPIIAAIPPECCPCQSCNGAGCSNCTNAQEFTWLLTYATVTDYTSDYKMDFGDNLGLGELNVQMSIEGATHWEPLNDIEWKYWGNNKPTYPNMSLPTAVKNLHPLFPRWSGRVDAGFQKQIGSGTLMYDPANWIEAYRPVMSRRARAATLPDSATPTVTISELVPYSYQVDVPYYTWSAQPRSMYYFGAMPKEGIITITVQGLTLQGTSVTTTAVLDLSELDANTNLAGGINPADTLLAGDVFGGYNGAYLLGGATPANIYVPWERTGLYPGEIIVGHNTIEVTLTGTDEELEFAYLHVYRRY